LANFSIILKEAGGTYGQSGGQVTQDAFANPLGTTYQQNVDGSFVYNPDGSPAVATLGSGFIKSGADGLANIKYLFPGKYTIEVIPPGTGWHQTTTIEGTKGIDTWVKANEPALSSGIQARRSPCGHGVRQELKGATVLKGTGSISGRIVNQHISRPPNRFTFYNGGPVPNCRIGLNEIAVVGGRAVYSAPCNADSTFSIPNVPAGTFQLVVWDEFLNRILATTNVTVPPGGNINLLDVPVFDWFGHYQASAFFDTNMNGSAMPARWACRTRR
jgi:hypothetical protein